MRTEPDADTARGPCPGCGEEAWVDPTEDVNRELLVDLDRRRGGDRGLRQLAVGLACVFAGLGLVGFAALPLEFGGGAEAVVSAVVIPLGVAALFLVAGAKRLQRARAPQRPARWRWSVDPQTEDATGTVEAAGPLLTAPLSGRRCVAYEIGARHDDHPRAAKGSWHLLEQRTAAIVVDGSTVRPDGVRLGLVREPCPITERGRRLLRERGLEPADSPRLYETIVEPGQRCAIEDGELRRTDGPRPTPRRLRIPWAWLSRALVTTYVIVTGLVAVIPVAEFLYSVNPSKAAGSFLAACFLCAVAVGGAPWLFRVLSERFSARTADAARLAVVALTLPMWPALYLSCVG